ncbi:MAG: efflux RND transporter periplasmic adaptor subunit [Kiritimatiellae bacterium]|nr:efflux RND transporter periplasmic adaptor subunit [Kiritimatiellia bacterium]
MAVDCVRPGASQRKCANARVARLLCAWLALGQAGRAANPAVTPHTVSDADCTVRFSFPGRTHISRGEVQGVNAPCENVTISWMCEPGRRVKKGDAVIVFDTSRRREELPLKQLDFEASERLLQLEELRLSRDLAALLDEKRRLEADLKVVEASLLSARTKDLNSVALLYENYVLAERNAEAKRAALKQSEELYALGEISKDKRLDARKAAEMADVAVRIPKTEWELAAGKLDRLAIEKLKLQRRQLRARLGLEAVGNAKGTQGVENEVEALRSKIQRRRKGLKDEARRAGRELHKAVRDGADHTPVAWLELSGADGSAVRRVNFLPASARNADGYRPDHGQPFSTERGYGWDRDVTALMTCRADDGEPASTLAVVDGQAAWSCAIADGRYTLKIGLGDEEDWDGPFVRCAGRVLFAEPRIQPGKRPVVEQPVQVEGGRLEIVFGDTCGKALRAPGDGVVTFDRWYEPGMRIWGTDWPLFYFSAPEKFTIQARVHQDLVGLLKAEPRKETRKPRKGRQGRRGGRARRGAPDENGMAESDEPPAPPPSAPEPDPAAPEEETDTQVAEAKNALATARLIILTSNGTTFTGTVTKITTQPVRMSERKLTWYERNVDNVKDKIAREIFIEVPKQDAAGLLLNETVSCTCEIALPAGQFALPVHLAANRENVNYVQEVGTDAPVEVSGFRAGSAFVATRGVRHGMRLLPPALPRAREQDDAFHIGEVIPDERSQIVVKHRVWGRIKEMEPEGARVEEGQVIVTLYSPWLEAEKERFTEDRKKANQRFLEAAEERRVRSVQAALTHQEKVIAEELARNAVRTVAEIDPLVEAKAENRYDIARLNSEHLRDRFEHRRDSGLSIPARIAQTRYDAKSAEIDATQKHLDLVAAERKLDWIAKLTARAEWQDAVEDLGLREGSMTIARMQEKVAGMKSKLELDRALEGSYWERRFEENKYVRAPRAGRLFYLKGWNDHTQSITTFQKDSLVWSGIPIAEVLDMSKLAFKAELPEALYGKIAPGMAVTVEFPQFNRRQVKGHVSDLGRRFYLPSEAVDEEHGEQALGSRRVFEVVVDFQPPPDLQQQLTPGTKGRLRIMQQAAAPQRSAQ